MRFIVYGAGAIGGIVGGRLAQHGYDVVLVARGEHHDAIRDSGLRIDGPDSSVTLAIPVVDSPTGIEFRADDVVLLCVKSQDTEAALTALEAIAPLTTAVVCVQNGVANERTTLRRFANVYGVCVVCPALHLEPGVVEAHAAPTTGILDLGRYPHGTDPTAAAISTAFASSTFASVPRADIMRWKYGKLLNDLSNAIDALCGPDPHGGELGRRARAEGEACLAAASIDAVSREEDAERRGDLFQWGGAAARYAPGSVVVAEPRGAPGRSRPTT